ncbi:hypothetical protein JCM8097_001875 [Rhodosporidiobolus ruineniae]
MASFAPMLRTRTFAASRPSTRAFASSSRALEEASTSSSTAATADNASSADTGALEIVQAAKETPSAPAGPQGKGFTAWLNGEGLRFKKPIKGRTNWIGETPFPLNPTFNPLPPLADSIKSKIYNAYVHNILLKDATDSQVVRAVSSRFGVSMDRVRAIIRLKELEKSWKDEGRALQTGLLKGMESYLGVKQPTEHWRGVEQPEPTEPTLASSKTIFEMVDSEAGDQPVLPLLKRVPNRTTPLTAVPPLSASSASDAAAALAAKKKNSRVVPASRPGRAATVFTDLSGTWRGDKMKASYDPKKTRRGHPAKLRAEKGKEAAQAQQA